MSSCSLSGVADLLRVTVALLVSVATFPIGSSFAAWSDGLATVAGEVGGVCACAIINGRDIAGRATASLSSGDGAAKTFAGLINQQTNQTAKINWRRVTRVSLSKTEIGEDRCAIEDSAG